MTTTSPEAFALLAQVATFAQDPRFAGQLKELVKKEEKHRAFLVRQADYIRNLQEVDIGSKRVRLLLELQVRRQLHYSPNQWVPDEFQAHEDYGLVHCQHHDVKNPGCDARTLTMTSLGDEVAKELRARFTQLSAVAA